MHCARTTRTVGRSRGARVARVAVLTVATFAAGVLAGCAPARKRAADARALAAADAEVRAGCRDCLARARDTYARLAVGRDATARLVRLFETELLIALREKELALDPTPALGRARALAGRVPGDLEPARVIGMVDAVLPDPAGVPTPRFAALRRERDPFRRRAAGELAWLATAPLTPIVRDYVALAVECSPTGRTVFPSGAPPSAARASAGAPDAPPLLVYRLGLCPPADTALLQRADAAVPGFDEAAYPLAAHAARAAGETGGDEARALFARVHARVPHAPGVAYLFAALESAVGDCESALGHADAALAVEPAHDGALLQRTACLSGLGRDSASVEAATRLVAAEASSSPQGHYWRALGRHRLGELAEARADIEIAKRRSEADNVLTLAGVIEHDQDSLVVAERDLRAALASFRGATNCTAAAYLARVLMKGARLRESADSFEGAMRCFDGKVTFATALLAKARDDTAMTPEFRARRVATLAGDSAAQRRSYFAAAFNGASVSARGGDLARAATLLDVAARDSTRAEVVAKLRAALRAAGGR